MDDALLKINSLLKSFNATFKLKIEESEGNEVNSLSIQELSGDGIDFINELTDLFDKVIKDITNEYELIYNEEQGLILAKKVASIDYEF